MLNQYAVGVPSLPVNLCLSHLMQFLVECKAVQKECRAKEKGRQAFGTRMVYRETFFADPVASSTAPYPQEFNPWSSRISEPIHSSTAEKIENETPVQDQRCLFGQSAENSVIPCEGDFSKNFGADQQRLQISDLHFDKFPTPATFACWKIRFKTEVCICSQFPTEAMLWIKEVEIVDSVDDLMSSSSVTLHSTILTRHACITAPQSPALVHSPCLSAHSCLQSLCTLDHSPNAFSLAQVR